MRGTWWAGLSLVAFLGLGLGAERASAFDPGQLHGLVDVTAAQGDRAGRDERTVRQDYRIQWSRDLFPNIQLRGGFRFYRFDLDEATTSYRRELRPDGELIWRHPAFGLNITGSRRETRTSLDPNDLIADDLGLALRTRSTRYPLVGLRLDLNQIEDQGPSDRRDTRDRRAQVSADHARGRQSASYLFTYRSSENLISDLESIERSHLLRLGQAPTPVTERLRLGANYRFTYREQDDKRTDAGEVLELVPIVTGLYREDPSPELDALAGLSALSDGDRAAPTIPAIDIGGVHVDRNVGVDLGFSRRTSVLYVYTDRPSGAMSWEVFSSEDNLTWSSAGTPSNRFNQALLRYEIAFADVESRYVKVVNSGLNPVAEVFVTEIEALVTITGRSEVSSVRRTHVADASAFYAFSERVDSSLDLALQHQPAQGGVGGRKNATYTFGSRFEPSEQVQHRVRWTQAFQFLDAPGEDLVDNAAAYTLTLRPLDGLTMEAGGLHRVLHSEGERTQEDNNVSLEVRGLPRRGLSFAAGTIHSRHNLYDARRRTDGWTHRASLETQATREMNATLSVSYQTLHNLPADTTHVRVQYGAGLDFQVSRTIFVRGSADILDDELIDTIEQDYLLSWTLVPKVRLSGTAALTNSTGEFDTQRYGALVDYELNRRTSVYYQYTQIDFSGAGGNETKTSQVGLRTSF